MPCSTILWTETIFFAILFNEAAFVIEPDLHALLHDLVDRDHILHYSWNMQDVPDVRLVALFVERDIIDMVCGVILIST